MFIGVQGSFIRRVCPRSHLCPNAKEINSSAHSEPIDELSFATCQKISRIKPWELIWWENVWVFVFGVCVWGTERESVPLQLRGDGAVGVTEIHLSAVTSRYYQSLVSVGNFLKNRPFSTSPAHWERSLEVRWSTYEVEIKEMGSP